MQIGIFVIFNNVPYTTKLIKRYFPEVSTT